MKTTPSHALNQYLLNKLNGDTKAFDVLMALFWDADKDGNVNITGRKFARDLGLPRSTIMRKLSKLSALSWIEMDKVVHKVAHSWPTTIIKINIIEELSVPFVVHFMAHSEKWFSGPLSTSKTNCVDSRLREINVAQWEVLDSLFSKRFIKELSPTEMLSQLGRSAPSAASNFSSDVSLSNDSEPLNSEPTHPFLGNEDSLASTSLQRANGEAGIQNRVEPPAANNIPDRDLELGVDDGVFDNGELSAKQEPTFSLSNEPTNVPAKKSAKKTRQRRKPAKPKTPAQLQAEAEKQELKEKNTQVWEAYLEAFKLRYPNNPDPLRGARINTRIRSLLTAFDFEVTLNLVRYYLQSNESFYIRNVHHLTCLTDAQWHALYMEMESGNKVTRQDAQSMELVSNNAAVVDRYLAKKHAKQREARQL